MTYRQQLIDECAAHHAKFPMMTSMFSCEQQADIKIRQRLITPGGQKDEILGPGGYPQEVRTAGFRSNLFLLAGFAIVGLILARVIK